MSSEQITPAPSERGKLSADDLITLNEEIAGMARAGLPLDQGLSALAREMGRGRAAITLTETTVALAITGVIAVIVAQCAVVVLRERGRLTARQAALELAANVLEEARALPWDKLGGDWAADQSIPEGMADLLPGGKVTMTVAPAEKAAHARRVTALVSWQFEPNVGPYSVELTTVLAARASRKAGAGK